MQLRVPVFSLTLHHRHNCGLGSEAVERESGRKQLFPPESWREGSKGDVRSPVLFLPRPGAASCCTGGHDPLRLRAHRDVMRRGAQDH